MNYFFTFYLFYQFVWTFFKKLRLSYLLPEFSFVSISWRLWYIIATLLCLCIQIYPTTHCDFLNNNIPYRASVSRYTIRHRIYVYVPLVPYVEHKRQLSIYPLDR